MGAAFLEWLRPIRLLGAVISAIVVLATAVAASRLPGVTTDTLLVAAILGGLMAFNTLLFFPPCGLALHPGRFLPALAVTVAPIPLVTLLYGVSQPLADCVLLTLAPGAVIARSYGATAGVLTMIGAINTLIALLFANVPELARLGAECGVIGTIMAFAADAVATVLLRFAGLRTGARIVRNELAGFLTDLAAAWRSASAWPRTRLSAHAERLQLLVAELDVAAAASHRPLLWPEDSLPPADLLEASSRSAEVLHVAPDLSEEERERVRTTLDALANARPLSEARPAVDALRDFALHGRAAGGDSAPTQLLSLSLLFADLVGASRMTGCHDPVSAATAAPQRPDATAWRLAAQAGVCMAAALVLMHALPFPKPYWLPLTTFILVSASFGETARKSFDRIIGTGAGLLMGQVIWMAAGGRTDVLTGVIAASLIGLFSARNAPYRVMLFWLTLMLAMVLHLADATLSFYAARLADTALGIVLVLVVTGFLLPVRTDQVARAKLRNLLASSAERLRAVAETLRAQGGQSHLGTVGDLAESARALRDLAAAEGLEDSLLRRPRRALAERQEAADRLVRVLIYMDQLVPILAARSVTTGTLAMLDSVIAVIQGIARRVGDDGSALDLRALQAQAAAQEKALAAAYAARSIDSVQMLAEQRMVGTLGLFLGSLARLAAAA